MSKTQRVLVVAGSDHQRLATRQNAPTPLFVGLVRPAQPDTKEVVDRYLKSLAKEVK